MNLKIRLSLMNFLEFAVWGAYLTSMGNYLGRAGMGAEISWFYAIQGIVSIFMPTIMGIVADRYVQPQRLLGICHFVAGVAMLSLCYIGMTNAEPDKAVFMSVYVVGVAFYMPTLALSNTSAFTMLKDRGMDTVKDFRPFASSVPWASSPRCGLSTVPCGTAVRCSSRSKKMRRSSSIHTCSSAFRAYWGCFSLPTA